MVASALGLACALGSSWASACETDKDCATGRVCRESRCSDPAGAKESSGVDTGEHTKAGNAGIITGYVFDGIGYIAIVGGGAASSENLGVGLAMIYVGSASLALASLIGTSAYTYRHGAYVDAGYKPRVGPKAGAWILTILSIGCVGASVPVGLKAGEEESFGLALASLGLAAGGGLLEAINISVRSSWDKALKSAPKANAPSALMLHPTVLRVPAVGGYETVPALAFSGNW
jgi:hypothetical protein